MTSLLSNYEFNTDNSIELSFKINELFSENTYLAAQIKTVKSKNGSYKTAYLYKQSGVRNYQKKIEDMLYKDYKDLIVLNKELFKSDKFFTRFEYSLTHNINRRDLSNFKKLIEDSMVRVIKKCLKSSKIEFDDSKIYGTIDEKIDSKELFESVKISIYSID